jgi:hypothetical protein
MGLEIPVRLQSIEAYIIAQHYGFRYLELNEIQTLDQWAGDIVQTIEDEWPVDTSTSRDAFSYTLMESGEVGFTILNDVDYVEYIHRKGTPSIAEGGTPLYAELIPQVIAQYREGMLQAMRDAVDVSEAALQAQPAPKPKRGTRGR